MKKAAANKNSPATFRVWEATVETYPPMLEPTKTRFDFAIGRRLNNFFTLSCALRIAE